MDKKELRKKAMNLPEKPGVYLMKDEDSEIIYVGKAKILKRRVSQYFGSDKKHDVKVKKMVSKVCNFDYIITDSEFEALVLECNLIKKYSPKYNILLKDDKGYHYIKITNEEWPRIEAVNVKKDDGAYYIGPYTSSWSAKKVVDEVPKIFKLPTCNRNFSAGRSRPCLNFYIGRCVAPCNGKISNSDYKKLFAEAKEFIKRGSSETLRKLREEMNLAANELKFEKAAQLRDRIKSIESIKEKQKVVSNRVKEQDVIAVVQGENRSSIQIFRFKDGDLYETENFIINESGDLQSIRTEFIERYYSIRDFVPKQITVDGTLEDENLIKEWLSKKRESSVAIVIPKIGEQLELVEMCRNNAYEALARYSGASRKEEIVLNELSQILGLSKDANYIEAYDVSNLQGTENVGAMVVYKDGKPLKNAYKKFKMQTIDGQDDYNSMKEMLTRRINEYKKNKNSGEGFGKLPDLVLIDGGKTHVKLVKEIAQKLNWRVQIYGMVKDSKHKTRAITTDGKEIMINKNKKIFNFITQIQDEVHRFAINYHKKRRTKSMLESELLKIDGIGKKRAKILLMKFGTLERIKLATLQELELIPGITKASSRAIKEYFS